MSDRPVVTSRELFQVGELSMGPDVVRIGAEAGLECRKRLCPPLGGAGALATPRGFEGRSAHRGQRGGAARSDGTAPPMGGRQGAGLDGKAFDQRVDRGDRPLSAAGRTDECLGERGRGMSSCLPRYGTVVFSSGAAASTNDRVIVALSSRRIEQAGLSENLVTQALMECVARDEVHGATENPGQLVSELLDVPSETCPGFKDVQHIDVALRVGVTPRDRSEHLEPRNAVVLADASDRLSVDVERIQRHGLSVGESIVG